MESKNKKQNPDETAAVLSFANNLSQSTLPKAPVQQQNQNGGNVGEQQLNQFKQQVIQMIDDKMNGIKDIIQEALKEDGK